MSQGTSSRRSALRTLLLGALAACDATVARIRGRKLVAVATTGDVPSGSAFRTRLAEQPIILVNDGHGIRTFLALCTHEGCPLGWNPAQHLIRCPCHGSAFSTSGAVVNGPAQSPLTELETVVERGTVFVAPSVAS
jgi:Rieske Fe-S protein